MAKDWVRIPIERKTAEKLMKLKSFGDTYTEVIERLIKR